MQVKQKANYELVITTNSYVGNFERELVSYALGILDCVQMELGDFHGSYEMDLFWKEEFNSHRKEYDDDYELKDGYLMETYQNVDDWKQMTFYHMKSQNNCCDSLSIQLLKPLNGFWEEIVIRRIKKFFDIHPCRYKWTLPENAILLDLYLIDSNGNIVKKYIEEETRNESK